MFPPLGTSVRSPLPSSGSRVAAVPRLHRYYGFIRLLSARPRRSPVSLDRRVPPRDASLFPRLAHPCPPGPGSFCRVNHTRSQRRRQRGLPGSWRIPLRACPGLGTPAAPGNLALSVTRMLPSDRLTASASATTNDFGAESARPAPSLPTLRTRRSPGEWQGSLPACQLRL